MNYLKKIKSLGFKKVPAIVICDYRNTWLINRTPVDNKWVSGFYIQKYSSIESNNKDKSEILKRTFKYPVINTNYVNKIHTYLYKISDSVNIYLLLVGAQYTLVVEDLSLSDTEDNYGYIYKNTVKVPFYSRILDNNFWREIMDSLDKKIQRDIIIKSILKSK